MIDSHCHLDACPSPAEAAAPELLAMVTVGTDSASNLASLELARRLSNVFAAVGIHPNNASDAKDAGVREEVEQQASNPQVVALGETGFDTYWDKESLADQLKAFNWQAELARHLGKALILHVRDKDGSEEASRTAAHAIREIGYPRGILHCFNGHPELLHAGLELGWMISFAGNLTYRRSQAIQQAARQVPQEQLLVETDSPYLAPVPKRGGRNTPAFVRFTAAFLAKLRALEPEVLEKLTDENAVRVYRLDL